MAPNEKLTFSLDLNRTQLVKQSNQDGLSQMNFDNHTYMKWLYFQTQL